MSNEAANMGTDLRIWQIRRGSERYILEVDIRKGELREGAAIYSMRLGGILRAGFPWSGITEGEVYFALNRVSCAKSPGLDGQTCEL